LNGLGSFVIAVFLLLPWLSVGVVLVAARRWVRGRTGREVGRRKPWASEVAMKITGDMVRGFWWGYVAGVLAHTAFDWWLR
jgi:hypothetical protein